MFDALEEIAKEIPRDTFDPQAIVDKVGKDPVALFEWVRDNTYLVPYRGTLRGPIGVLMDRLGNSLDRALLLHKLLSIAGHEARLARGKLSDAQVESVLDEARSIHGVGTFPLREGSVKTIRALITKYSEQYDLDPAELQRVIYKLRLTQQHISEELAQRVEEQTTAILRLIGEKNIDIRKAERVTAIDALKDHWWVERRGTPGWMQLDPSLRKARAGEPLGKRGSVLQPNEIGEELQHRVTIRVKVERWVDGKLETQPAPVLEYTVRPSKLFGQRVVLRYVPLNWREDFNLSAEEHTLERLTVAVSQEKEWLPVLSVGSTQIVQSSFTDSGEVKEEPGKKPASPAEGVGRIVGGLFGGMTEALSGGHPEEDDKIRAQLTAVWVEYELEIPGEGVEKIRRQVFDTIGPASRLRLRLPYWSLSKQQRIDRALALRGEIDILPSVYRFSGGFLAHLSAERLIANRTILLQIVRRRLTVDTERRVDIVSLPGPLYGLADSRLANSPFSTKIYINRPNVLTFHKWYESKEEEQIFLRQGFDIVANYIGVLPRSAENPFAVRLAQGVLDTNVEAKLLERGGRTTNAANLFSMSSAHGLDWICLTSKADSGWRRVGVSGDLRARIERELARGFIAVVPGLPKETSERLSGWWRIWPDTGQTLGIGSFGWGQETTEEVILLRETEKWKVMTKGFAIGILCIFGLSIGETMFSLIDYGEVASGDPYSFYEEIVSICVLAGIGTGVGAWLGDYELIYGGLTWLIAKAVKSIQRKYSE